MRNIPILTVSAFVLLLLATGCKGQVHVDAIEPACRIIVARDAAYIQADPNLTPAEKAMQLKTGELLLQVIDEAKK